MITSIEAVFLLMIVLAIARSPVFPLILYAILLASEWFWSGLSRFIRMIFFPSEAFVLFSRILGARILGIPVRVYRTLPSRPRVVARLPLSATRTVLAFIVVPAVVALSLFTLFSFLALSTGLFLVFWWLALSAFLSMPRLDDWRTVYYVICASDPITFGFLILTPVVFILSLLTFGALALPLTLFYVLSAVLLRPKRPEEEPVVADGDIMYYVSMLGET